MDVLTASQQIRDRGYAGDFLTPSDAEGFHQLKPAFIKQMQAPSRGRGSILRYPHREDPRRPLGQQVDFEFTAASEAKKQLIPELAPVVDFIEPIRMFSRAVLIDLIRHDPSIPPPQRTNYTYSGDFSTVEIHYYPPIGEDDQNTLRFFMHKDKYSILTFLIQLEPGLNFDDTTPPPDPHLAIANRYLLPDTLLVAHGQGMDLLTEKKVALPHSISMPANANRVSIVFKYVPSVFEVCELYNAARGISQHATRLPPGDPAEIELCRFFPELVPVS